MTYSNEWLLDRLASGESFDYVYFWGHRPAKDGRITKSCLSQWYASPFTHEGRTYATAEHWMMWHKARIAGRPDIAEDILTDPDPRRAKALGREAAGPRNPTWDAQKYPLVVQGNVLKFEQNLQERIFLYDTGLDVLVEASPFDPQWGIGMDQQTAEGLHPREWKGTNLLGYALMEAREELRTVRR